MSSEPASMKSYKASAAVIILLLILTACGLPGVSSVTPIPTQTPINAPLDQVVRLESLTYQESGQGSKYELIVHTPVLQGSDDLRIQDFIEQVAALIQLEVGDFRGLLSEMPSEPISAGSFFELSFEVVARRAGISSIQLLSDVYADGAAHPYRVIHSFNYDLESGQSLQLEQLFIPGSHYLQLLSGYCVTELDRREIGAWHAGAFPVVENYQVWNIAEAGLQVTFNEYQAPPYAAGLQTVLVPFSYLTDILLPGVAP
ncbi:MAG: DUF3298 domain-containing protein [Anaerolineales bacterium]|nr:DUF3298 domain-containing protein [Anaerolineales bacterium]